MSTIIASSSDYFRHNDLHPIDVSRKHVLDDIRHNNGRVVVKKTTITRKKVSKILGTDFLGEKSFSDTIDGLKVGHKVSVNGDKGVVTGFETIGDQKIGVEVGVGGDTKVMISSKQSAIEKKMNILKKPLRNKRKKPKTYEILA